MYLLRTFTPKHGILLEMLEVLLKRSSDQVYIYTYKFPKIIYILLDLKEFSGGAAGHASGSGFNFNSFNY